MNGDAAVVEADAQGRYVDADAKALELYGIDREELRRHRVGDFAPDGLGPIHRALFLWTTGQGRDFGGGSSTIVRLDGSEVRIRCTSIRPHGDNFRIELIPEDGDSVPPHSEAVASILEAWREAEREIFDGGRTEPEFELARQAASSLRDIYQFVVREKTAALARIGDL